MTCGVVAEELARGDVNYSLFVQIGLISGELISAGASPDVQAEWLPRLATGEKIVAFALTEPGAGSDASRIAARAVKDGSDYLLTGEKASVTFAGLADACLVFARSGDEGAHGISCFLVPLGLEGVSRSVYDSPGERLSQRGSIFLQSVRVPARNRLGDEKGGFAQAMVAFDFNRAVIALSCVGAALQSLDETVEYTKTRVAFGKPLAKFEGVAFQVAEHLSLVGAARLVAYECLSLKDRDERHTKEAAMAKWLGPKLSAEAIHACLLLHGHYGYNRESPLEQRWRDVVGMEIGDGTPEIMKGVIAREVFGKDFVSYR